MQEVVSPWIRRDLIYFLLCQTDCKVVVIVVVADVYFEP